MDKTYIQKKILGTPGQVLSFANKVIDGVTYKEAVAVDGSINLLKAAKLTVHAPDRDSRIIVTNGLQTFDSNPSYLELVPSGSEGLTTSTDSDFYVEESLDRVFYLPTLGDWVVVATKGGIQTQSTISILSPGSYEISLSYFQAYIDVVFTPGAICRCTNGQVTLEASGDDNVYTFTVNQPGDWTVEAIVPNGAAAAETVSVEFNKQQIYVYLDTVSRLLKDNSWKTIKAVTELGLASSYWRVGDCKSVTLNGTVGSKNFSNEIVYAEIIGFDHNKDYESSSKFTTSFQLGKVGVDSFVSGQNNGIKVGLYNSSFTMQTSGTNSGGWQSSNMRMTLMPALLNALPNEVSTDPLTPYLFIVKKATDNNSGSHSTSSVTSETYDSLFLLSSAEVFGPVSGDSRDANQKRYAYYQTNSTNALRIRYQSQATTSATAWWLRTPYSGTSNYYIVSTAGAQSSSSASSTSCMIVPVFVIGGQAIVLHE